MMRKADFQELVHIMERLREPGGCPWDREQTLETLKDFLIEEAYEVLEAINNRDLAHLKEELGDLLYQILFISRIAEEENQFDIHDVVSGIADKMKRRHPHVFGTEDLRTAEHVLERWEEIKMEEKNGHVNSSTLAGIPAALPALQKAKRISEKVARVGFDWETVTDIMEKLNEEVSELSDSIQHEDFSRSEEEIGDLLFVIVNVGRRLGIDPEVALQRSNMKFIKRFEYVEKELKSRGKKPSSSTLEEMEYLWKEAKKYD
ncbi:MAG: nucleoside triphosphate pyrophosphohydrolase [Acidobacteriota bacterium]